MKLLPAKVQKPTYFSKRILILVAIAFAAVGGWVLLTSLASVTSQPGDLNGDGKVDIVDLSLMLSSYNASNPGAGDINGDNKADILDLSILLSNFGKTVSPAVCTGVDLNVGSDIQQLIKNNPEGTTFCFGTGIYRLTAPLIPKSNDQFIGRPGAILNGAKDISAAFVASGQFWVASNQTQQNQTYGQCLSGKPCQYPDDVYMDDKPLVRVIGLSELKPGSFYFDYGADKIYIADNPAGHKIEAAVASGAFHGAQVGAYGVTIKQLTVEKFANSNFGAINATNWTIQNNEVRLNHATGIEGGTVIQDNYVHDNGQLGIAAFHTGKTIVSGNQVARNNYAGYSGGWEAGGIKFGVATDITFDNNDVHDNDGPGIWCDTDCLRITYSNNKVQNNSGPGIDHEVSYDATITGNTVTGNGFGQTGTFQGAGILLQDSQNLNIYSNTVSDNLQGIGFTQIDRGGGAYGTFTTANNQVHDNDITMSGGATGMVSWSGDLTVFTSKNNRFYNNRYTLACSLAKPFIWQGGALTWAQWQAAGNDTAGTISFLPC